MSLSVSGNGDASPWVEPRRPHDGEPDLLADLPRQHCGYHWTDRTALRLSWVCTEKPGHLGDHVNTHPRTSVIQARRKQRRGSK